MKQTITTADKSAKIARDIEMFLANGGKIDVRPPYDTGYNNTLRHCRCGCRGIVDKHCEKRMKAKEREFPYKGLKDL